MIIIICGTCGKEFERTGRAQKYCVDCAKKRQRASQDKHRVKKGVKVNVGSGNAQGSGKNHHTYKSGISSFRRVKLSSMSSFFCENCNKDLNGIVNNKEKRHFWCVHHIDGNRKNNELNNLKLLCKRCHQIIHKCIDNLSQNLLKV